MNPNVLITRFLNSIIFTRPLTGVESTSGSSVHLSICLFVCPSVKMTWMVGHPYMKMHFIHNVHKQKVKVVFVKMELEWTPVSCLKSYILAKTLQGVSKKAT